MIAIASLAAGCSFSSNAAKSDSNTSHDGSGSGSGIIDAGIDAPPDAPNLDLGPAPFTVHLMALPSGPVTLPGSINTDTDTHCSTAATWVSALQPDACFIVGTSITSAGSATAAVGTRPLVLVATQTIDLSKSLSVATHRTGAHGAGSDFSGCTFSTNPTSGGEGGGAGGTFMTQGGLGAQGDNGADNGGSAPNPVSAPTVLRGGCPGQKGGSTGSGNPGSGGGAMLLVAGQSIVLESVQLNASGGAGTHGDHSSGGSGGGSGGMIILYAPAITATGAVLMSNGAGASSGGDSNNNGNDGMDPAMAMTPAPGGVGAGGSGGSGAILTTSGTAGTGGNSNQGGGGGGGGVGYIRSNVTLTGAIASPAPDVVP